MSKFPEGYHSRCITDVLLSNKSKMESLLKTKHLISNQDNYEAFRTDYFNMHRTINTSYQNKNRFPNIKKKFNSPLQINQFSKCFSSGKKSEEFKNLYSKIPPPKYYEATRFKIKNIFSKTQSLYILFK